MSWDEREAAEWLVQLRRGVLELCVMSAIADDPRYGYELVSELAASEPLAAMEGTVYPLLRRLRQAGFVETSWQESPAGPPRQYYRLAPVGRRALRGMRRSWRELVSAVDRFTREEAIA
ncbi:MAG TPA: PadR family transcriptional regulator [Candidatus Limnocylindria bacterium]|jgi:PadR family transcriptional regulator PadR|nr:PadR family transcriptional regulator [Candidatus Limnocylindria bacterium]